MRSETSGANRIMTLRLIIKLTAYKILLFCMYYFLLAVYWESDHFVQDGGLSPKTMLFSWAVFVLSLPLAVKLSKNEKLDGNIFFALYLAYFIPALAFWEFNPEPFAYIAVQLIYFVVMALAIIFIPEFKFRPRPANGYKQYYHRVLLAVGAIIAYCFVATGSSFLFSLSSVYDVRSLWAMESMPVIFRYLFSSCRGLLPLLFGIAICRKAYLEAGIVLFLVLMSFSIDGLKSAAFITLLTGCGVFISWRNRHISDGFLCLTACGMLEYWLFDSYKIVDYLRRVLAIPAQLNYFFYDYFSQVENPYDFFRQGLIGKFGFRSPYDTVVYKIIGGEYYNNWDMLANNGLVSDAFYNLGWVGAVIMPVMVVLMIKLISACSADLPKQILLGVIIAVTYWLITASFFTLFFTHGVAILLIFLYFLPTINTNQTPEIHHVNRK